MHAAVLQRNGVLASRESRSLTQRRARPTETRGWRSDPFVKRRGPRGAALRATFRCFGFRAVPTFPAHRQVAVFVRAPFSILVRRLAGLAAFV